MKVLFTICGRAGSKGIKNKNIRPFLDKPLPLYALSAIDLCLKDNPDIEGDIAVNTDSPELVEILCDSGMRKVEYVPRKDEHAGDKVGKWDVIQDTMFEMENRGGRYDLLVDMDITSPLRCRGDLDNVIREASTGKWDVVFTVTESRRSPYFNMVKDMGDEGFKRVIESNYIARQQAPQVYDMNASIYAYRPEFLRTSANIFDGRCGTVKMYDTGILDLDHENDLELMEIIAQYLFDSKAEFRDIFDNISC